MERALIKKGIRFLSYFNDEGDRVCFAFTPQMFDKKVFILLVMAEMGEEDDPEYETALSVHMLTKDCAYDFTITVDDRPVIPLLYLYRLILDIVGIVGDCKGEAFIEDLKSVSTGVSTSKEIGSKKDSNSAYQYTENYWNILLTLIEENRIQGN